MRTSRFILLAMALFSFYAHAKDDRNLVVSQVNNAVSEKRIALVIGNSAYINSPLKNPINDAQDVAAKLRKLGFDVIERDNLTTKQIGRTLSEFRSKLVPGSVALMFYAGHGLQIKGENYLPAIDAEIAAEEDVPTQSIAVRHIMEVLDEAKTRLNLVFLDACRNNPYSRSFRSAAGDGLARITAPSGTLISYATRPGSVAQDGNGRNGLYTSKLLAQMDSNLQIEQALKQVVSEVEEASQGKQEPWMEGNIKGDFCFAGCQVASLETVPAPPAIHVKSIEEIEQESWDSARESNDVDAVKEFIKQYPKSRFVGQAKILIASLKAQQNKPEQVTIATTRKPDNESDLWIEVQKSNTVDEYSTYLTQHPKGKYVALAKGRIKKLQEEASAEAARNEQEMWQAANNSHNLDGYKNYLLAYPNGRWAAVSNDEIGNLFQNGLGVAKDYDEAVKWYRKAAEKGDAYGQFALGAMYEYGYGVAKDYAEAAKWYRKSAAQGNAIAQSNLGIMYEYGHGVAKDFKEAVKWYRKAAEQGNAIAQNNLGRMYDYGQGVVKDYDEAVKWYRKAAEQGDADAQSNLGNKYHNGQGVPKDMDEAVKWYRKAAEQGNAEGQFLLGSMYYYGQGVTKDYDETVKWYRKAAEQGNAGGQATLGFMYQNGWGVAKDYAEAFKWLRKATEQGDAFAQYGLGLMYQNGQGVAKDSDEAVKWFRKSAEQGNADGQSALGLMYEYGQGVAKDYDEALKWFRKAAEQGNAGAQGNLGIMYDYGRGVAIDYAEAVKWYRKAAAQGDAISQSNLGSMYYNGQGVPKDIDEAVKWYRKAADQGNTYAQSALKNLSR